MKFEQYTSQRDRQNFFESAGFKQSDVQVAADAMRVWVDSTNHLLEAMSRIPETSGSLGGSNSEGERLSEQPLEQAVAVEVQRARTVFDDVDLVDLASRVNQFAARIQAGLHNIN